MSKSSEGPDLLALVDGLACCVPLAREPISAEQAHGVVPMLKAIADPARLRLLSLGGSAEGGGAGVCDQLPHHDHPVPPVRPHRAGLHEAGLLERERRGTWVYYIARPETMAALGSLFNLPTSTTTSQTMEGASA